MYAAIRERAHHSNCTRRAHAPAGAGEGVQLVRGPVAGAAVPGVGAAGTEARAGGASWGHEGVLAGKEVAGPGAAVRGRLAGGLVGEAQHAAVAHHALTDNAAGKQRQCRQEAQVSWHVGGGANLPVARKPGVRMGRATETSARKGRVSETRSRAHDKCQAPSSHWWHQGLLLL